MTLKTKLLQDGRTIELGDLDSTFTKLPTGVYLVSYNDRKGYYLRESTGFNIPKKIYNDPTPLIDRWLKAWEVTSKNLGIMLNGIKGSGKTITAELLCLKSNMPVLLITEPYFDNDFKDFITNPIFNGCVIFIDEFEKIYGDKDTSNSLLSIMDGMYDTHLLFLLTTNNPQISEYLVNRPGRIKYMKNYGYLTPNEAHEVIQDLLVNKEHTQSIYDIIEKYSICTMDILIKLIGDMNLFNEDAVVCSSYMNLIPEAKDYTFYIDIDGTLKQIYKRYNVPDINEVEVYIGFPSDTLLDIQKYFSKQLKKPLKEIKDQNPGFHIDVDINQANKEKTEDGIILKKVSVGRFNNEPLYLDILVKHEKFFSPNFVL